MYDLLAGIRVIESSAFIAAPSGGMTLAQLGADVIRVDPIGGGIDARRWPLAHGVGASLYWAGLNKGKRSLALNLRDPAARELLATLITAPGTDGGLFLTNLPQRGELAYESLAARRSDVVMLSVTGSPDGRTAVDYTVNAAVGIPFTTGDARPDRPVNNALPAWDLVTGASAALGLLAAERHRTRTGRGQHVRLALSDVAMWSVAALGHLAEAELDGVERQPQGNHVYGAFGRDFGTADGRRVMLVAISTRQWRNLVAATASEEAMQALGRRLGVDLDDEGRRYEAREAIAAVIEQWTARHTLADIGTIFDRHGVCWGPYQSFTTLLAEDARCSSANPMFEQVTQAGIGRCLMPGSPFDFEALARRPVAPAPRLGEHTDEVLAEVLGLDSGTIARLHDEGAVAGPDGR